MQFRDCDGVQMQFRDWCSAIVEREQELQPPLWLRDSSDSLTERRLWWTRYTSESWLPPAACITWNLDISRFVVHLIPILYLFPSPRPPLPINLEYINLDQPGIWIFPDLLFISFSFCTSSPLLRSLHSRSTQKSRLSSDSFLRQHSIVINWGFQVIDIRKPL